MRAINSLGCCAQNVTQSASEKQRLTPLANQLGAAPEMITTGSPSILTTAAPYVILAIW
jgi:hypothetical protein